LFFLSPVPVVVATLLLALALVLVASVLLTLRSASWLLLLLRSSVLLRNTILLGNAIWHTLEHWVELLLRHLLKLRHLHLLHLLHLLHWLHSWHAWLAWSTLSVLTIVHHRLHLLELYEVLLGDEPTDLRVGCLVKLRKLRDIAAVSKLLNVLIGGEIWSVLFSLVLFDKGLQVSTDSFDLSLFLLDLFLLLVNIDRLVGDLSLKLRISRSDHFE